MAGSTTKIPATIFNTVIPRSIVATRAQRHVHRALTESLTDEQRKKLDHLLESGDGGSHSLSENDGILLFSIRKLLTAVSMSWPS